MVYRKKLPNMASVANSQGDTRLYSPSAERNSGPIVKTIQRIAPKSGQALEIASGTGQHIVKLASSLPNLSWLPSEVDEARLESISAWIAAENLPNIKPPLYLDATETGWAKSLPRFDFILLVNLLHLISWNETETLIDEIPKVLKRSGTVLINNVSMLTSIRAISTTASDSLSSLWSIRLNRSPDVKKSSIRGVLDGFRH